MCVKNSIGRNASSHSRFSTANKKSAMALAAAAGLGLMAGSRLANADVMVWTNGAADSTWNNTSLDWNDVTTSTNPAMYSDTTLNPPTATAVQFSDSITPSAAITVANVTGTPAGVSPGSVEFTHTASATGGSYTFNDTGGGTNGIEGAATVTFDAGYAGTVYLDGTNTYSGGTFINGGIVQPAASGSFGSGNITLGGGEIQNAHSSATIPNNIIVTAGTTTNTINSSGDNPTLNGTISSSGGATTGNTTLNLNGNSATTIGPVSGSTNTLAGFTGTVELNGLTGVVRFSPVTSAGNQVGSSTALFDLGTGTATLQLQNTIGMALLGGLEGGSGTLLGGNTHNSSVNYNAQSEFVVGGAGLNTIFNGSITNNQRANLVVTGGGSLTLSTGYASTTAYTSRSSGGSTPSNYQGPGTWILGQGQGAPALTALPATFPAGTPISSAGGMLFVSNTTNSGTGPSPVLVEGATTNTGAGATLGGDGIITGLVTTSPTEVGETNVTSYASTFTAGPIIDPVAAGVNTSKVLTLSGGLMLGDYSNLDMSLDTLPNTAADAQISMGAAGVLTLPVDDNIGVNFSFPNGNPALNTPYTLISYTAADVNGGAGVAHFVPAGVPFGDKVAFNDTGSAITATFSVPEPASLGLLAVGVLGLMNRRRSWSAK
jgi:fibronectin-binding autotransporter adhesin